MLEIRRYGSSLRRGRGTASNSTMLAKVLERQDTEVKEAAMRDLAPSANPTREESSGSRIRPATTDQPYFEFQCRSGRGSFPARQRRSTAVRAVRSSDHQWAKRLITFWRKPRLPRGVIQSRTDFGIAGYGGACPPPGSVHRYQFTVYALSVGDLTKSGFPVDANSPAAMVSFLVHSNALDHATIEVLYQR
jgi:hypothetical protein